MQPGLEAADEAFEPRAAFLTAVAATALNPLTIRSWTVSFSAAAPASGSGSAAAAFVLVAGVAVGTLSWYCGFSTAVALVGRRLGERLMRAVDVGSGCGLVAFGGLLGYRALRDR